MLSTVPRYRVGMKPTERHSSITNWLNSGARSSSDSSMRLRGQRGHRDVGSAAKAWPSATSTPSGSSRNSSEATCRWGQRGPSDADVEPPVHQSLELLGHTDLDLVDLQVGVLGLDLAQDQRHRVVARIDDSHPQARP